MMNFVATIDCADDLTLKDTLVGDLSEFIKAIDGQGTVTPRLTSSDKAHALDPAMLQLLLAFSGSTVLAAGIKGFVEYLVQKAKAKKSTIKLTIKKMKIEISGDTPPNKVAAYVKEVMDALAHGA